MSDEALVTRRALLAGAAVAAVADCVGVDGKMVEAAARRFVPLPHRVQALGEIDGVAYVNDSKATNLAAMAAAACCTAAGPCRSSTTPPTSDLWSRSGETILSATAPPSSAAMAAACSGGVAVRVGTGGIP